MSNNDRRRININGATHHNNIFSNYIHLCKPQINMYMNLQAQLEAMQASFERLQDSESKVSNIKQRIFLMQKMMGEDPEKRTTAPTFAHQYKPKNVSDNSDEMEMLRAKLRG